MINGFLVTFNSTDGLTLNGFLKKSNKNNKKLLIHVHGMGGNFYGGKLTQTILKELENTKYDVLSINTRGQGIINRIYGKNKKKLIGTGLEKLEECIFDIEGAIKFAKKLGYKKFVLSGHSTGCQKITYYQSKKQNNLVESIVLLSPADDHSVTKTRKNFNINLKKAQKLLKNKKGNEKFDIPKNNYSVKRWLSFADKKNIEAQLFNYDGKLYYFSKIKQPILAIFGENDIFANHNAKQSLEILRNKTKSELLITKEVKGADHSYKGKEKQLTNEVKRFLELF